MKYAHARLVVFAKQAIPGQVKTRLIPALGEGGATSLHRAMVERVAAILSQAQLAPWRFAVAGEAEDPLFAGKGADLPPLVQHGNDLGERMANAVEESFAGQDGEGGVDAVLLLGADCPAIDSGVIETALAELARGTEVVFVPAEDGGYVLLGLRRPMPCLFHEMPWGTSAILRMSVERLEESKVKYRCLDVLWDVDVPADLDRLAQLDPPLKWRRT